MKIKKIHVLTLILIILCNIFVACNTTPTITEIKVSKMPDKIQYYVGEQFSATGGELTVSFSDGTQEIVPMTSEGVAISVNTSSAGSKTATITYLNKRVRFNINVSVETFTVTFVLNYTNSPEPKIITVDKGDKLEEPKELPQRESHVFYGWFSDEICTMMYDFEEVITSNIILYAGWLEDAVYYDAVFDYNYYGAKVSSATLKVKEGEAVRRPSVNPSRPGYAFVDWYANQDGTELFNFDSIFSSNKKIYAHWSKTTSGIQTYVFEAEDTSLVGKSGPGISGSSGGKDMIVYQTGWEASGNRFVSHLYKFANTLDFYIASDEAVSGVTLTARLAAEFENINLSTSNYWILVNGEQISYNDINLVQDSPFQDYILSTDINLVKGKNEIVFFTANNINPIGGGTLQATAPMIDCIKLTSSSVLMWDGTFDLPKAGNY